MRTFNSLLFPSPGHSEYSPPQEVHNLTLNYINQLQWCNLVEVDFRGINNLCLEYLGPKQET
ncbi:MAG: hypothetical protein ACI936_001858 [Paraglaciecola sp.]|jgi:hypothetical protein